MNELFFSIDFLLCLAIALLGILLINTLRKRSDEEYFSPLLYYVVFFSAFGLYGIWGQQFIQHVLLSVESPELLQKISGFISILGIPFLVTGWFMLLYMIFSALDFPLKGWIIWMFFVINIVGVILSFLFNVPLRADAILPDSHQLVVSLTTLIYFLGSGILLFAINKEKGEARKTYQILAGILTASGLLIAITIFFTGLNLYLDLAAALLFFVGMILPVVYIYLHPFPEDPMAFGKAEDVSEKTFEDFCITYEISPREQEIILELCSGKSNQEIADALFITIQTVKDHLYRIYIKTEVKNRVQLTNLVRGFNSVSH